MLWIAHHAELLGDPVLGPEARVRFLPSRFTVEGQAIDARRMVCQQTACPRCHLNVPRQLVDSEPLFISIIGVPASGKSYFLTAMTWELRQVLPKHFGITFTDVDTLTNHVLNEYEETLFLQNDPDKIVAIRKTETEGDLYDQVHLGQQILNLPRPFLFSLNRSTPQASGEQVNRVICLYDNAGEHFQPGMDTVASPVTQHLAKSKVLMFLYDPTQDPRFRERCRKVSNDPQLAGGARSQRQETIFIEAAARIRRYTAMPANKKHDRPLVVIVPKLDAWESLLSAPVPAEPVAHHGSWSSVTVGPVEAVSARVRALLHETSPEFVAAVEDFCQHVVYIPVSALGHPPEEMSPESRLLGIRPRHIRPRWVTVPLLYAFAKWSTGLISATGGVPLRAPQAAVK